MQSNGVENRINEIKSTIPSKASLEFAYHKKRSEESIKAECDKMEEYIRNTLASKISNGSKLYDEMKSKIKQGSKLYDEMKGKENIIEGVYQSELGKIAESYDKVLMDLIIEKAKRESEILSLNVDSVNLSKAQQMATKEFLQKAEKGETDFALLKESKMKERQKKKNETILQSKEAELQEIEKVIAKTVEMKNKDIQELFFEKKEEIQERKPKMNFLEKLGANINRLFRAKKVMKETLSTIGKEITEKASASLTRIENKTIDTAIKVEKATKETAKDLGFKVAEKYYGTKEDLKVAKEKATRWAQGKTAEFKENAIYEAKMIAGVVASPFVLTAKGISHVTKASVKLGKSAIEAVTEKGYNFRAGAIDKLVETAQKMQEKEQQRGVQRQTRKDEFSLEQ